MSIITEQDLVDKGKEILESHLEELKKTPGYQSWCLHETQDFLPNQITLALLVRVDGDSVFKEVAEHIERVEDKAYQEFADLDIPLELEGRVFIFIFMDFEEGA